MQQLCLITKIDQQEAYAPVRSLGLTMALTGFAVLFLGSLGAIILARSITKPIFQLVHGTEQIGQGNLNYHIDVASKDEIGLLGSAFNRMAAVIASKDAELRTWAQDLEQKVEERTAELSESEIRYHTLLEASPDMIFVVNREHKVQYINSQAANLLGNNEGEIVGKPIVELFPSDIANHQIPAIQEVLQSGQPISSESEVKVPGGTYWLDSRIVPIVDQEGHVNAVMGVSRDISDRKKAEEKI